MKALVLVMMLTALMFSVEPDNFFYFQLLDKNNNGALEFHNLPLGRGVYPGSEWDLTPNWTGNIKYNELKYKLYDDYGTPWQGWTGVHPVTFDIILEWTSMINDIENAMDDWESVGASLSPVSWDPSHEVEPDGAGNYDAIIIYFNDNEDDFLPASPGLAGVALGTIVQDLESTQKFWYTYNLEDNGLTEWTRSGANGSPVPIEQTRVMLNSTDSFFEHFLSGGWP